MHLFTDIVEPLTLWLYANPHWALLITFIISFTESLAIIGSIIPGSVTMTAIGILAGSGIMDIGLTYLAATLGAVVGDSASYTLGYTFSDHLADIWPFRRYPQWICYGKDYFAKHGGKSVIIGRFFGPLRSIIPVIAGILHMNRWHFLLANIISAIGWAILYVTPGVLIGAASSELSAESATRLFILILTLLGMIWLISQGMQWLFQRADYLLHTVLQKLWNWARRHPNLAHFLKVLTPNYDKKNHYSTAALVLLFLICLMISVVITVLVIQGTWVTAINNPCLLFLQSLRTQPFDAFFIVMSLAITPISLISLSLAIALYAMYFREWRLLRYWISLGISCSVVAALLISWVDIPKPSSLLNYRLKPEYPAFNLTLATALFGFLISYVNACHRTIAMFVLKVILLTLLFFAGLSSIYLGDNWATSSIAAYFIAVTIYLAHWILFRRNALYPRSTLQSQWLIILSCSLLVFTTSISYHLYFKKYVRDHASRLQQFVLTPDAWWHQNQSLLPVYTKNRIGHRVGLFNVQYLGDLNKFEKSLIDHGWKKQSHSFFHSLLMRAGGKKLNYESPLMAQLYFNKQPNLIMTYQSSLEKNTYVLQLWRSNYHLRHHRQPIWLGSLIFVPKKTNDAGKDYKKQDLFQYLTPALEEYKFNIITLPKKQINSIPLNIQPGLLIIKE